MGPVITLWVCSIFSSLLLALLTVTMMHIYKMHSNFMQDGGIETALMLLTIIDVLEGMFCGRGLVTPPSHQCGDED